MKKIVGTAALAGLVALSATACGAAPDSGSGGSSSSSSGSAGAGAGGKNASYKGCMVSDSGGFQDHSFNESGFKGLNAAKSSLGIQVVSTESKVEADYTPNIDSLIGRQCNLIISVGFALTDATAAAAAANPKTQFALVDSTVKPARPNVKPLEFDTAQAAYLAGYVAAGTTKTGTVATYGGQQFPSVTIFMDGFADGVAKYDQDNGKSVKVLGWDKAAQNGTFTGDFEDASKGRNTTQNFIDAGADIILPVAGPVGAGTLAAAKAAKDVKVIWVDADGYETQPQFRDIILTSVVKEVGKSVQDVLKADVSGSYSADPYVGTLANGGISLAPFHDLDSAVPQPVKDGVKKLQQQITSGSLKVTSPSTP